MPNVQLTKSQDALLYLICRLNQLDIRIDAQKKLQKLMFLVEHYNPRLKQLRTLGLLGNNFIIYHFGVFSFDVRNDYFELDSLGLTTDYPTIRVKNRAAIKRIDLDNKAKYVIDKVLGEFGKDAPWKLEDETLEMLGYDRQTKYEVFGRPVTELIKNGGIKPKRTSAPPPIQTAPV
jgi:hypothetical protein